ncbi:MAG: lipopolysaccharide biosynthesis protein [Candidatus Odinarchaeia archaeon]
MLEKILTLFNKAIHERGFIYVSLGTLFYTSLAAVFWFILARILPVNEYGFINYYLSIATVGATIAVLGLKTTIVTFYPKEENTSLIAEAYTITFIIGVFISVFLAFSGQLITALLVLVELAFTMFIGETLGKREYKKYMIVSIANRLSQIALSLSLYVYLGVIGIFIGYIVTFAAFSLKYFLGLFKSKFSVRELKNKFSFIVFSYSNDLATVLAGFFDKILVGWLLGLIVLAYYHLAFQIYWVLAILPAILINYLLPEKSGGAVRREIEILGLGMAVALAFLAIISSPIIVPLIFPDFANSVPLIQIISLAVIPATAVSIKQANFFSMEKPLIVLLGRIINVSIELICILILPWWFGYSGLAIAIVVSQAAFMVFLEISDKKLNLTESKNSQG